MTLVFYTGGSMITTLSLNKDAFWGFDLQEES